jgi:hypothetical protein
MATLRNLPQIEYDVSNEFGEDLSLSNSGDLALASGSLLGQQRVLRRLLTNPNSYCWHPNYGAGVPATIGLALSPDLYDQIKSLILSNLFLESTVAQSPPPEIFLQIIQNGLYSQINYTDAPTQQPIVITFNTSI